MNLKAGPYQRTGIEIKYNDGATITTNQNITLYAIWEALIKEELPYLRTTGDQYIDTRSGC